MHYRIPLRSPHRHGIDKFTINQGETHPLPTGWPTGPFDRHISYKYDSRLLGYFQVESDSLGPASETCSYREICAQTQIFPLQYLSPKEEHSKWAGRFPQKDPICIKMEPSLAPSPSKLAVSHWKPLRGCSSPKLRFLVFRQRKFLDDSCQSRLARRPALPET